MSRKSDFSFSELHLSNSPEGAGWLSLTALLRIQPTNENMQLEFTIYTEVDQRSGVSDHPL